MRVVPMIFNTEMVKALIAGDKVVTRRQVSPQPKPSEHGYDWWPSNKLEAMIPVSGFEKIDCDLEREFAKDVVRDACPIANIGDLIYVRETLGCCGVRSVYRADDDGASCKVKKWTPSIHMPRRASRITLKVTDVRIERVQDITEEQAILEGMPTREEAQNMAIECGLNWYQGPKAWFRGVWDRIYGNWSDNPYVWVIEFEVIKENIDKYIQSLN